MSEVREKRDLVLPPGAYAYMQDVTKGVIKTYTGPTVINPTAQEVPVTYDPSNGTFGRATTLEDAVRNSPVAVEGYYVQLLNPARAKKQPEEGMAQASADLDVGRKVNIPGPTMFALWPGQAAEVIRGHHLRSNQYLLVRVYNEDEARKNWAKAVVKVTKDPSSITPETLSEFQASQVSVTLAPPPDLTVGRLFIIRGTEVSFYIPPTGLTVVADGNDAQGKSSYAREALTLERLEYAILIEENGKKRYEIGPSVVFPLPTERFVQSKDDKGQMNRKFRAIELNEIQGLHIKVIAPYEEQDGTKRKTGDELFITGKDTAIYYPREEHSAVKYDGRSKHFATAVPAGEARYVMNRITGAIRTVHGPHMLLPDPRTEVIVRRALTDKQVQLWYPGNDEALAYNRELRNLAAKAPVTRQGSVSEGEIERALKSKGATTTDSFLLASTSMNFMESSKVSQDQNIIGDEFSRASTYTSPRAITLDTKYQGAPTIDLWTNYAVLVVSKTGARRVEVGPTTIPLEYDESLEALELSTGKPKNTDTLFRTTYLRVENNKVSDIVTAETSDHVNVLLKLSYRVNFEGDSKMWFAVENYVKFLCDHARSVLKGAIQKMKVEEFYSNSTDIIRDVLLGKALAPAATRPGMSFPENGMRILDVEVLGVTVQDDRIKGLLDTAQHDVVKSNIEISNLQRQQQLFLEKERIDLETATAKAGVRRSKDELDRELLASQLAVSLAKVGNAMAEQEGAARLERERLAQAAEKATSGLQIEKLVNDQRLAASREEQVLKIELLKAEAEAVVARFAAVTGNFSEALLSLSNNETMVKVAEAWSIQRAIGGDSVSDALTKVFSGTSLGNVVKKLTNGNGNISSNIPHVGVPLPAKT